MFLCKISSDSLSNLFKSVDSITIPPNKMEDFGLVLIGQDLDGSSFLGLATKTNNALIKQTSVPEGYTFIFRQEWGLGITEETIHRIISTLRAEAYPPMSDYLDAKVKGDTAQEQAYLDACAAVKVKYPKFSW